MMWPWKRRETIRVAVPPPPVAALANGNGTARNGRSTGEWDELVDAEEAGADAALARHREACDATLSAVRARRASGGHAPVKP